MSSDDGTEVETDDDSSGAPVDALNEGDAFERLIQVAAARRSAAGGPGGPAGRQPFTATVEDEGDRFVGGISPTHAVNEDDDDDEVFLSPRRRRGLGGGAGPARAPPSQPAFRRHSKGWITLEDGIVSEEDLDTAIAKHADKVSRGRGFTPAGSWRNGKNNGVSSRAWRCLYRGCPAMLRVEKDISGRCEIFRSSGSGNEHNAHIELGVEGISVPGEIRALLSPNKLAMPPKRARHYLRQCLLPDGRNVRICLLAPWTKPHKELYTPIFGYVQSHIWVCTPPPHPCPLSASLALLPSGGSRLGREHRLRCATSCGS